MYRITVTVHASARRRTVEEISPNTYKVQTTTAPEKGKANQDVIDLLADHLKIRKSSITLERGTSSKKKTFLIEK